MSIDDKQFVVEMPNGEKWAVPVHIIAFDRAKHYFNRGNEFSSIQDAYKDTEEMFEDDYEIEDWARNNMNWDEVKEHASRHGVIKCDYQEGWLNGNCEIID